MCGEVTDNALKEKCNIAQFTDTLSEVLESLAVAAAHKAHSVGSNYSHWQCFA